MTGTSAITTYGGKRTIATEMQFTAATFGFIGANNTAGVGRSAAAGTTCSSPGW